MKARVVAQLFYKYFIQGGSYRAFIMLFLRLEGVSRHDQTCAHFARYRGGLQARAEGIAREKVGDVRPKYLNQTERPVWAWLELYLTPKRYSLKCQSSSALSLMPRFSIQLLTNNQLNTQSDWLQILRNVAYELNLRQVDLCLIILRLFLSFVRSARAIFKRRSRKRPNQQARKELLALLERIGKNFKKILPYIFQFLCMVLRFGAFMTKMIITRGRTATKLKKKTILFFWFQVLKLYPNAARRNELGRLPLKE